MPPLGVAGDRLGPAMAKAVFIAVLRCPLNQGQVAEKSGINEGAMSNKLRGKRPFSHGELSRVAAVTGTTVGALYAEAEAIWASAQS